MLSILIQQYQPPILNISLHLGFTANNTITGVGGWGRIVCWDLFFLSSRQFKKIYSCLTWRSVKNITLQCIYYLVTYVSFNKICRSLDSSKQGEKRNFLHSVKTVSLYIYIILEFSMWKSFYWAVLACCSVSETWVTAVLINAYFSAEEVLYSAMKVMNCNISTQCLIQQKLNSFCVWLNFQISALFSEEGKTQQLTQRNTYSSRETKGL